MTSAFFAVLFGGNWLDCVAAGVVGLVLALAVTGASRLRFNDFCQNAAGSFCPGGDGAADTAAGILQYEY